MSGVEDPPEENTPEGAHDPWGPPPGVPPASALPDPPVAPPAPDDAPAPLAVDPGADRVSAAASPIVADSAPGELPPQTSPGAENPAGGYGWPMPADARQENGAEPSSVAAPASPPPPTRPEHHSRNPVDRLTRGLPNGLRVTIDWVVTIVGAVAIVLLVKAYVVNPYRIPSSSMEPTLHCSQPAVGCETKSVGPVDLSDRVLANRFLYKIRDPRRGEIIVFKTPAAAQLKCGAGGTFVKRLIGLPGDTVEVKLRSGDGYVTINGKPLKEPYIEKARRGAVGSFGPIRVKPGNYFMMGDNRSQSCDSRLWGTVPRENLIGKVFATYWPPKRISLH